MGAGGNFLSLHAVDRNSLELEMRIIAQRRKA
jgi:hypothetical protein